MVDEPFKLEHYWSNTKTYNAMIGIGVSDPFHGKGLADFGVLFLKLVATIAEAVQGLAVRRKNERAIRFHKLQGFR